MTFDKASIQCLELFPSGFIYVGIEILNTLQERLGVLNSLECVS